MNKPRPAFSLLELLLALVLSVVVLGFVATATYLHTRTLNVRRTQVEEAELARAVLRRLADDIRGAVPYLEVDLSGLEKLAGGEISPDLLGGETGGVGGEVSPTTVPEISASTQPAAVPGIYGTQNAIEIDMSRLPRLDEYWPGVCSRAQPPPSDVKTVAWYLRSENDSSPPNNAAAPSGAARSLPGLVRRELDRSATLFAAENGDESRLENHEQLIATEVLALEFRYFDGQEWLSEWNSDEQGRLPMAVEIAVAVEIQGADNGTGDNALIYRLVASPPTARLPEEEEETVPEVDEGAAMSGEQEATK